MSKVVQRLSQHLPVIGVGAGVLVFVSGVLGLAVMGGPDSADASVLPALQLLLGTALVVRFTVGRHRTTSHR